METGDIVCDCDFDSNEQVELSKKENECKTDSSKKKTTFGRRLLSPAFFQSSTKPETGRWSFASGTFQSENEWKPKFLQFCKESSRMKTFSTWPKQMNPKPDELAKAGFFYEGVSDTCRCFFCGVIVHNWEIKDEAFEEHLKHSPKCHYLTYHM